MKTINLNFKHHSLRNLFRIASAAVTLISCRQNSVEAPKSTGARLTTDSGKKSIVQFAEPKENELKSKNELDAANGSSDFTISELLNSNSANLELAGSKNQCVLRVLACGKDESFAQRKAMIGQAGEFTDNLSCGKSVATEFSTKCVDGKLRIWMEPLDEGGLEFSWNKNSIKDNQENVDVNAAEIAVTPNGVGGCTLQGESFANGQNMGLWISSLTNKEDTLKCVDGDVKSANATSYSYAGNLSNLRRAPTAPAGGCSLQGEVFTNGQDMGAWISSTSNKSDTLKCVDGSLLSAGISPGYNYDPYRFSLARASAAKPSGGTNTTGQASNCPTGFESVAGACQSKCASGQSRVNGTCSAATSQCGTGYQSVGGQCIPNCTTGTSLQNGSCVANTSCGSGLQNVGGQCVPVCASGTTLQNGSCVATTSCGIGLQNVGGQCIPVCASGTTLQNGSCVATTTCGIGFQKVGGQCIPNCSSGTVLQNGSCIPIVSCGIGEQNVGGVCIPNCTGGTRLQNGSCI